MTMDAAGGKRTSLRFGLRNVFLVFAVAAVVSWSACQFIARICDNSTEEDVVSGLMQISSGLATYRDALKCSPFPPTDVLDSNGNPILSWRVRVLGAITSPPTEYNLNVSWTSSANRLLGKWPCWVYCPDKGIESDDCETMIYAIYGEDAAFDPSRPIGASAVDDDVILMMDVADSGTHWMEPGDYQVARLLQCTGRLRDCVESNVEGRVYVLFADGEIWCLNSDIPMQLVKPFLTLDAARKQSGRDKLEEYCLQKWNTVGITD